MSRNEILPPADLAGRIIARITLLERRAARHRLVLAGGLNLLSFAALILISRSVYQSLVQTGFLDYLSLAVSDQAALSTYARELGLTLLESLPVLGLISFFSLLGLLWWSIIKTIKQYGIQANLAV